MEKTRSGQRLLVLLILLQGLYGVAGGEIKHQAVNQVGDKAKLGDKAKPPHEPISKVTVSVNPAHVAVKAKLGDKEKPVLEPISKVTVSVNPAHVAVKAKLADKEKPVHEPISKVTVSVNPAHVAVKAKLGDKEKPVLERISKVTVTVSKSDLVEFNDTVILNCTASGSAPSFKWSNGSSDITDREHIKLKDDNRTLVISSVSRFDHGPFFCNVSNSINKASSAPQYLTISYGPDDLKLTINRSQKRTFPVGSNLTLSCSALSSPPAEFDWTFKGKLLEKAPELKLDDVQKNHSGSYTCLAHNSKTLRYRSSTEAITITKSHSDSVQPMMRSVALLSFLLAVVLQ